MSWMDERLIEEEYKGYVIRAVSFKMSMREGRIRSRNPREKKDDWYPAFRVFRKGGELVTLEDVVADPIRGTRKRADEIALAKGKWWIDNQLTEGKKE